MEGLPSGSPSSSSFMSARSQSSESIAIPKATIRRVGLIVGAVLAVVAAALLVLALIRFFGSSDTLGSGINSGEYQAVFLANGQVYFGKLTAPGGNFYYLRHVYYLSTLAAPLSRKTPTQQLIKLGGEIHGPEDLMIINRSQILFVENLKRNGKVTQAILQNGG